MTQCDFLCRSSLKETTQGYQLTMDYYRNEAILLCSGALSSATSAAILNFSVFLIKVNEYRLPFNFYIVSLPFEGYSINWLLNWLQQSISLCLMGLFFVPYVASFLLLINHSCWKIDVLILDVKEDVEISEKLEAEEQTDATGTDRKLKKIVDNSCKLLEWIEDLQRILKFHFLLEFSLLSFILCVSVYAATTDPFGSYAPYTLFAFPMSQLFLYCWIGNRVIFRIEQLSTVIYDIKWYNLKVEQQKALQMILIMSQRVKGFDGIFKRVDMETFQKVWTISITGQHEL